MPPSLSRKTELLRRHRRRQRLVLVALAALALILGMTLGPAWGGGFLLLAWLVHEVVGSDHLFYAANADQVHAFTGGDQLPVHFASGRLALATPASLTEETTLMLEIDLVSRLSGFWFDPAVSIRSPNGELLDIQTFERGARGRRVLNLTGLAAVLSAVGLDLDGRHCHLVGTPRLWGFLHPDYRQKRLLVVAPHADDAELAAFGLYRQAAVRDDAWVVTLTAGEIETEAYRRMGLPERAAALLKGRLRAWDSMAVPQWAGVRAEQAIQLGYFCMRLAEMRAAPETEFGSRVEGLNDPRLFRRWNRMRLASDQGGIFNWQTLLADLQEILRLARPEVIVLPHPVLDPHPDHVAAHAAVLEALAGLREQGEAPVLLGYANHLHDNDRWPLGDAHRGVPPPPCFAAALPLNPWCLTLDAETQLDKAMALGMEHDLTTSLPGKKRLRRLLQTLCVRRRHPPYGASEFFRKAVRRHELFWVLEGRHAGDGKQGTA